MSFTFSAVNLGCNKNMVDLEFAIGELLKLQGKYDVTYFESPEEADYVIVNTCWFLSSSRLESENTVRYFDRLWKKIIVMGCYIPVENDNFFSSLKHLHALVPFINYSNVEELVTGKKSSSSPKPTLNLAWLKKAKSMVAKDDGQEKLENYLETVEQKKWENAKAFIWKGNETRAYFNAPYGYEFLKIAEGCDNNCSFCIIPQIRGKQKSRDIESILQEVQTMVASGIKEIQILSQDTTRYGTDIYKKPMLFELLEKIDALEGDFQFKVYYLYPDVITLTHLKKLKALKKFIPYFDIPLQHIAPNVLKRMGRFYDDVHIIKLLDFIRSEFPESFIHTNFIIWFPGETESDFKSLVAFIEKYRFESISFFEYHDEPLAASSKLDSKVSHNIAMRRLKELDEVVDKVYKNHKKEKKGKKLTWYIHDVQGKTFLIREVHQAPEIDEYYSVRSKNILQWEMQLWEKVIFQIS